VAVAVGRGVFVGGTGVGVAVGGSGVGVLVRVGTTVAVAVGAGVSLGAAVGGSSVGIAAGVAGRAQAASKPASSDRKPVKRRV
jgi:hypothetical protein